MINSQLFDSRREIEQFKLQLGKLEGIVNISQPNSKQNIILLKQLQNKVSNLEQNLEQKVNAMCSNVKLYLIKIIIPDIQPQKLPELNEMQRKRAVSTDVANHSVNIEKNIFLQGNKASRYSKMNNFRQQSILNEYNDESLKQKIDLSFEQSQQHHQTSFQIIHKPQKQRTQVLLFDCPAPKPMKKVEKKQFQFMIQKGKRIQAVELLAFKQKNLQEWNLINAIIQRMESINIKYQCPTFFVDGRSIIHLIHCRRTITLSDIVKCIQNKDEIIPYLFPRLFIGQDGLERAAEKIQAAFKGYIQFRRFQQLKTLYKSTIYIQKYFRRKQQKELTKQRVLQRTNSIYKEFLQRQTMFQDNWNQYKLYPRVEIHLSSLNYSEYQRLTMDKFIQKENSQISRIFRAIDPQVEIIYICAYEQDKDILMYYERIFEMHQVSFKKVRFLTPENADKFNTHMSLLQKLIYSPKCLKQIRKIIENKLAMVIPGYPSNEFIQLCHMLNVPLYSGLPQHHLLYSSQSGAQVLFSKCKIPTSPGASEIYDEIELYNTLTVLIVKNRNTRIWIFKIDCSFGGRGIATINISTIPGLNQLLNCNEQELDENTISAIKQIIKTQLPLKLKIAVKSLYQSYKEYITAFLTSGGIVEAFPIQDRLKIQKTSISFHVSPQYEFEEICTYDSFSAHHYVQTLHLYPSITSTMDKNKFYEEMLVFLKQKKMFGYFTLHLILFDNQFWAIGLDSYLNVATSINYYFKCLNKKQTRFYLYSPYVIHPGLQKISIKQLFSTCRMDQVQYETEYQRGQTFLFTDILQSCMVQMISVHENIQRCISQFDEQLKVLFKLGGQMNVNYGESIYESRNDSINILDVQGALKMLRRKLQNQQ
ncbi:unnamed protein product (macronuclear) [Paramecium tetraurelia]|uniref:IQCH-like ATP-grasp domain-containing protein n=1 Tax=Paramecium tetraurelia TaxID=5888 RepID=A0E4U3_PARTE|nr:uncharacterized protein GSPATT00023486001 [Paramecium tetraurelia]CAK90310.1 unnamed protein product [Paramecium tetraurelia]|eukprot:XP_001457707.1 hypothetical protein (macronuclear) [Paramecium tetraurelia strain d4-2]